MYAAGNNVVDYGGDHVKSTDETASELLQASFSGELDHSGSAREWDEIMNTNVGKEAEEHRVSIEEGQANEKGTEVGEGKPEYSVTTKRSAAESNMPEEDFHTPSGQRGDWPQFTYNDKPSSSLRRRPRSFSKGSKDGSSVVSSADPKNWLLAEDIDISAISGSENESRSGVSGDTTGRSQLQKEDGDTVSEVDNGKPPRRRKESAFHSGYDPELEDDDNDASSVSSREPDTGMDAWKRRGPPLKEKGWEEGGSSSDLEGTVPVSETRQTREVYRMPGSNVEVENNEGETPTPLPLLPAGFIVMAIEFQVKLIVHALAIGIWLINFAISTMSSPINRTLAVKDKATGMATGAVNQVFGATSVVKEGVSQAGPLLTRMSKKTFRGCLGAAYVIFMLCLLLIPVLFVDLIVVNRFVEEPVVVHQTLDFDYTQPRPSAFFPLFSPREVERVKNLKPHKTVKTRVIPAGHKFHITVVLTLPESDYNMKLGMFQLTAELLSARDLLLLRSSKPCRLRFSSFPVQLMKNMVYAVPHFLGWSTASQKLEIRLLEAEEKAIPTASVRILLEPKASYRDGGGVPEIYDAKLRLESSLPWAQVIMGNLKWTFFVWNGLCLFLFEVSVVLCCCRRVLIPSFGGQKGAEEEIVQGEVNDEKSAREYSSARRARSKRRVYFDDDSPGAAGAYEGRGTGMPMNMEEADSAEGTVIDSDPPSW